MNGVSDRLQIDETFRTACQKQNRGTGRYLLHAIFLKDSVISALTVTIGKSTSYFLMTVCIIIS